MFSFFVQPQAGRFFEVVLRGNRMFPTGPDSAENIVFRRETVDTDGLVGVYVRSDGVVFDTLRLEARGVLYRTVWGPAGCRYVSLGFYRKVGTRVALRQFQNCGVLTFDTLRTESGRLVF